MGLRHPMRRLSGQSPKKALSSVLMEVRRSIKAGEEMIAAGASRLGLSGSAAILGGLS